LIHKSCGAGLSQEINRRGESKITLSLSRSAGSQFFEYDAFVNQGARLAVEHPVVPVLGTIEDRLRAPEAAESQRGVCLVHVDSSVPDHAPGELDLIEFVVRFLFGHGFMKFQRLRDGWKAFRAAIHPKEHVSHHPFNLSKLATIHSHARSLVDNRRVKFDCLSVFRERLRLVPLVEGNSDVCDAGREKVLMKQIFRLPGDLLKRAISFFGVSSSFLIKMN
jgi:hypothetical protein